MFDKIFNLYRQIYLPPLHQGREWKIELYFSSDWKFLAICLGLNAANSKYFCPWCEISKEQQGDLSLEWKINKTINNIHQNYKYYRGHICLAIFDMIPLQNWVPDELHIMLRITDVLWRLVIDELKSKNTWGNKARDVIIEEMKRINVRFHFWLEVGSSTWQYTSLMGQDKLTVLQHFNLSKLFPHSRAIQIRNLWDNFYLLHKAMKDFNTDAKMFSNDTYAWLHQFLNSDFYQASDITPYIHVLVYHIPEMIKIHNHFGLAAFSCSAVEKKNHQQVSHFFKKTTKDGGGGKNGKGRKSAILDILEHENRMLYFYNCREWKIELYFSSDWKFLAICLGLNAANSKYFCPWCEISKEQQGDLSLEWKINKTINNIHQNYKCYRGHIRPAIFDMIPLQNWVPDELHIMLRITDVLWRLVIDELKSKNTWGNKARDVIIEEMKRINVRFHFWLEVGSSTWQYTSLMGQDKLTVLQHFNLSKLFPHSRAIQIRNLWDNFYLLHKAMKDFNTDAKMFSNDTYAWLHQFLNSDFYQASDITPYIHVLVYHIPEMIKIHNHFGLAAFSCSAVEKKNHQQVSHFFKKTTKDGDGGKNGKGRKSAILDILEHENRMLYFYNCNEIESIHLPKRLRIQTE
ncbi:hypothetical protein Glove_62g41 [Diversispora epigaea]|uniref:Uncharacterized protein n=1 Tax=Diversispora epigaea TaxID=1348612 RepID=A0A397JI99_9GLOM|nr:hypothetical protein Glove_62g41 [Diversispora epigaea]